jgi:hypothetical protein
VNRPLIAAFSTFPLTVTVEVVAEIDYILRLMSTTLPFTNLSGVSTVRGP